MLKISAFYLDKQKSFIPKKNIKCTMNQPKDAVLSPNTPSIYTRDFTKFSIKVA